MTRLCTGSIGQKYFDVTTATNAAIRNAVPIKKKFNLWNKRLRSESRFAASSITVASSLILLHRLVNTARYEGLF